MDDAQITIRHSVRKVPGTSWLAPVRYQEFFTRETFAEKEISSSKNLHV
jgi:hypothetical protein